MLMRKLCPNFDREDGLETVLEVPIPEEVFASRSGKSRRGAGGVGGWMRLHTGRPAHAAPVTLGRNAELQLLLGVIAAPLVPLPIPAQQTMISHHAMKGEPTEASMAKYIVKQYVAASGGDAALDAISSMYAMGKVRMTASEFRTGSDVDAGVNKCMISGMGHGGGNGGAKKSGKGGGGGVGFGGGRGEVGGFVLWQKKPDLWCLELVVSGCKISAGSDGKVAWRQTPWHQPHASRGPPRPLRRSLQGLDPRSTANLFSNAVWIGEKTINGDDCFVLKLDADPAALRARSSNSVEIIRHTVWGYFSHRTGLLVQLEDTHMLRIKAGGGGDDDSVYWETRMESLIEDYRPVDGVNIAHAGRTVVSLFRFGDSAEGHTRTRMEETWTVEEVDFNIWGLSMECFLPPSDLKKEQQEEGCGGVDVDLVKSVRPPPRVIPSAMAAVVGRIGASQVAAIETEESSTDSTEDDDVGGL